MVNENFETFFYNNFQFIKKGISYNDLDNMYPFERDIYKLMIMKEVNHA